MLIDIPAVLDPDRLQAIRTSLVERDDAWVDGRVTAGHQGGQIKRNLQTDEMNPVARGLGDMIVEALERNPRFISAALPNRVYPPIFNRYEAGMHFGSHVDGAVRIVPSTGAKLRTDLSATLFISDPGSYDGGELLIEDTYGVHGAKLPAGHLIVYPATSLHRVTPVTRGTRLASVMWVQSLVRDDGRRALLFDLDNAIQRLNATQGDDSIAAPTRRCRPTGKSMSATATAMPASTNTRPTAGCSKAGASPAPIRGSSTSCTISQPMPMASSMSPIARTIAYRCSTATANMKRSGTICTAPARCIAAAAGIQISSSANSVRACRSIAGFQTWVLA